MVSSISKGSDADPREDPAKFSRPGLLGVVVVNYRSHHLLEANLHQETLPDNCTVVIVDNFSDAGERFAIARLCRSRRWHLVEADNDGFGAGANQGARLAAQLGCDAFLFLNPDAVVDAHMVEQLRKHVISHPSSAASPRIVDSSGGDYFAGAVVRLTSGRIAGKVSARGRPDLQDWLSGTCLAISRGLFEAVDGFDPDYFLYWEDVDLSVRLIRAGGSLHLRDDLVARHDEGGSQQPSGQRAKSSDYYYYNCRNRLVFAAKYLTKRTVLRWLVLTPLESWQVLLRGGRRQLLQEPRLLLAAVRGSLSGVKFAMRSLGTRRKRAAIYAREPYRIRVYQTVRTAHLERAHKLPPASILFQTRRYDFDEDLARGLDLIQTGTLGLVWHILSRRPTTVEINEPLQRAGLVGSAAAVIAGHAAALLSGRPVQIVTYAIENKDPFDSPRPNRLRSTLRWSVERFLARVVARGVGRIVFGTAGAEAVYSKRFPRELKRSQRTLVPALPTACDCRRQQSSPDEVLYLGALHPRKGVLDLVMAWPFVAASNPHARLTIVGKGELESEVRRLIAKDARIELVIDPPRPVIHELLARSAVLVLLSASTPTWREQVGLPIVEGLAHGCEIVTTDQTGLADWLLRHGHRVLEDGSKHEDVAAAIAAALTSPRSSADILAHLPHVDGRLDADRFLFSSSRSVTGR